jgi:oxalate decarboxylase/phosphoglucose isomerase-like protein (cupin superfamily)
LYVLDGEVRFKLGDEIQAAPAGSFVFIPRGAPHTWQNVGDGRARFLATVIPASIEFEEFFLRYSALPPEERGIEAFSRLAAETGAMEVLGPPLAQSDPC